MRPTATCRADFNGSLGSYGKLSSYIFFGISPSLYQNFLLTLSLSYAGLFKQGVSGFRARVLAYGIPDCAMVLAVKRLLTYQPSAFALMVEKKQRIYCFCATHQLGPYLLRTVCTVIEARRGWESRRRSIDGKDGPLLSHRSTYQGFGLSKSLSTTACDNPKPTSFFAIGDTHSAPDVVFSIYTAYSSLVLDSRSFSVTRLASAASPSVPAPISPPRAHHHTTSSSILTRRAHSTRPHTADYHTPWKLTAAIAARLESSTLVYRRSAHRTAVATTERWRLRPTRSPAYLP